MIESNKNLRLKENALTVTLPQNISRHSKTKFYTNPESFQYQPSLSLLSLY
ncbi:MAG: hypothetical protein LBF88_07720 [Planctomycetaceae bacterium]|nr:hypothetical protein [Planctomycetaceae bacterium]